MRRNGKTCSRALQKPKKMSHCFAMLAMTTLSSSSMVVM